MKKLMIISAAVFLALVFVGGRVAADDASVAIDGNINPEEGWNEHHLGVITTIGPDGMMQVDVFGFAKGGYLYAAYRADTDQDGWATACASGMDAVFDYRTPSNANLPEPGYTRLQMADEATVLQTDGTDWAAQGSLSDLGLEYAYVPLLPSQQSSCETGENGANTAEIKIPLALITYAGTDGKVRLSGQYWQPSSGRGFTVDLPPSVIQMEIDIKPGSDANPINPKSKGVIPVAILGSDSFDVTAIDLATLAFGPNGAAPVHNGHFENIDGDDYMDLVTHYRTQDTGIAKGDTEACLMGESTTGVPIEGCDAIRTVGK